MKNIRDELQHIIIGNGQVGHSGKLKKTQDFLRRNAETSRGTENKKPVKSEEASCLIAFAEKEDLFYEEVISEEAFISAGGRTKGLLLRWRLYN